MEAKPKFEIGQHVRSRNNPWVMEAITDRQYKAQWWMYRTTNNLGYPCKHWLAEPILIGISEDEISG